MNEEERIREDTVMSDEQIMELEPRFKEMDAFVCDGTDFDKVAKAQAKLTWPIAEKAGIQKVVDWAKEDCPHLHPRYRPQPKRDCELCWQVFLKEVEK